MPRFKAQIQAGRALKVFVLNINLLCSYNMGLAAERPESGDYLFAAGGLGLAMGFELLIKDQLLPDVPRFSNPNRFDTSIRNSLYWGAEHRELAETWSDRLIYGVSMSSLLWGPLSSRETGRSALINMEVFSANSILTNLFKVSAGRERPYHHYGTRESSGKTDYASFFSGHSSIAFSQAVTNALLLSLDYPQYKTLIWSSLLGTAGLTAYLRVASDMHYFSDILVGACAGSFVAWTITSLELRRLNRSPSNAAKIALSYGGSSRDFNFTLKIPLG